MNRQTSKLEINLVITLDALAKISQGLYPDPRMAAESIIQLSQFKLNQHGQLVEREDPAAHWLNWLEQQQANL